MFRRPFSSTFLTAASIAIGRYHSGHLSEAEFCRTYCKDAASGPDVEAAIFPTSFDISSISTRQVLGSLMISCTEDHARIDDDRDPVGIFFKPGRNYREVVSYIDRVEILLPVLVPVFLRRSK